MKTVKDIKKSVEKVEEGEIFIRISPEGDTELLKDRRSLEFLSIYKDKNYRHAITDINWRSIEQISEEIKAKHYHNVLEDMYWDFDREKRKSGINDQKEINNQWFEYCKNTHSIRRMVSFFRNLKKNHLEGFLMGRMIKLYD